MEIPSQAMNSTEEEAPKNEAEFISMKSVSKDIANLCIEKACVVWDSCFIFWVSIEQHSLEKADAVQKIIASDLVDFYSGHWSSHVDISGSFDVLRFIQQEDVRDNRACGKGEHSYLELRCRQAFDFSHNELDTEPENLNHSTHLHKDIPLALVLDLSF